MLDAHIGAVGVWLALVASITGALLIVADLVARRHEVYVEAGTAPAGTHTVTPGSRFGDGRFMAPVMLGGTLLAVGAMEHALVTHDFALVFVASNNSTVTPLLYSITGLWSALAGSILLWGLLLAVFSTIFVVRYRRQAADPVIRWATLVLYVVSAFFLALMVGPANPFTTAAGVTSGIGPNSLLQDNPLVAIHPPLLYAGFVGFTVPFAFAIGMLATGRVGERWQVECRRWTLVAFTFLSVGIVLGAWWSYQVLGWGGFWGWDPVENAALLPWLCGTAYLHSVLVQERRGLMRVWNLSLSVATFALTILGTFLTRSGVITSVHAFSESSLGPLLIGFFFAVIIVGFGLIAWRGDRLRSPGGIDAPLGREGAFLLNNVLFVGFAFVVLLGTVYPLLYEALTQQQVTVGAPFFNTVAVPAGIALLFLMAVAPVLSWRKMSGTTLWHRLVIPVWIGVGTVVLCVAAGLRGAATLVGFGLAAMAAATAARALVLSVRAARARHAGWWRGVVGRTNGGMIVHLGVVVLAVGIIAATSYRHQAELALRPGTVVNYDGHRFEFLGLRTVRTPAQTASEAVVKVDNGVFTPATTSFGSALSEVGTPAIDSGLFGDVYLTFDAVGGLGNTSGNQAINNLPAGSVAIGVVIEPLVAWLWAGGLLIGLGGVLALVPGSRRRATEPASAPSALVTDKGEQAPEERAQAPEPESEPVESEPEPEPVGALVARRSGATA
ncbi:MAG TPA: cytochrome c-type biogenesis CcmF C-terminal domain-containing protein [Acidimicrobiales bacterium]